MFRRHVLELDVLDSPIISPTPLSVGGLGMPGSALAERIFNDPEAWTTADDEDDEEGEEILQQDMIRFGTLGQNNQDDPLAWLAEEIEKFQARSAGAQDVFVENKDDDDDDETPELKQFQDKYRLTPTESTYAWGAKWEGVKDNEPDMIRPISLTNLFDKNVEFGSDVQSHLAKIFRSIPTTPQSSGSNSSEASSSSVSPGRLNIDVEVKGDPDTPVTPIISPVAVHSASTTLSFLEWYGIYPDSPQLERVIRKSMQLAKKGQKPSLQLPPMPISRSPDAIAPQPDESNKTGRLTIPQDDLVAGNAKKPPSRRTSPIPPPGLMQSLEEIAPMAQPSLPKPPTTGLPPVPPPSYRRSPSPSSNSRSATPETRRVLSSNSPAPYYRTPTKSAAVSVETPVRRLPLVPGNTPSSSPQAPLRTATPPSSQKVVPHPPPPRTATPERKPELPPCGPDHVPRKCSTPCAGTRPLSAARSPPAGPMGPRSRSMMRSASFGSFSGELGGTRSTSGQRRPPALKFDSSPQLAH